MLIRVVILAIILLVAVAVVQGVVDIIRAVAARRGPGTGGRSARSSAHERRFPPSSASRAPEPGRSGYRAEILRFVESHGGVEAYLEPATSVAPRSVVLVDGDGEWRRYAVPDDAPLRALAKRGIPIYDVRKLDYPKRMRQRGHGRGGDATGR